MKEDKVDDNTIIEIDTGLFDTLYEDKNSLLEDNFEDKKKKKKKETKTKAPKKETIDLENTIVEHLNTEELVLNAPQKEIEDIPEPIAINKKKKAKKNPYEDKGKKSIVIVVIISIVILLGCGGYALYYFGIFDKEPVNNEVKEAESIVLEKDNYIYKDGVLSILNTSGKSIGEYTCIDKDTNKCYVAELSYKDDKLNAPEYINEKGDPIKRTSKVYNNRFVFIYDNNQINLYDLETNETLDKMSLIKTGTVSSNLIVYKNLDGNYGIYNIGEEKAEIAIKPTYDYIALADSTEKFIVTSSYKSNLMDFKEKTLSSKISGDIVSFSDNYIIGKNNDKYSLYDYTGVKALPTDYDYMAFDTTNIVTITGGKLTLFDKELNKLNFTQIKLRNTDYNKVYVFDSSNNIKETRNAYTISYETGLINIEVTDGAIAQINLYENALNQKYDYIIYSDGSLYFYTDEEKLELLGSYKCTNKNQIDKNSTDFTSCFIAKDTSIISNNDINGYIPIINNNYVFIQDGETLVVYSLSANKKISTNFTSVDSNIGTDKITYLDSLNHQFIFKNSSNKYGIITFNTSGSQVLLPTSRTKDGVTDYTLGIKKYSDEYYIVNRTIENCLVSTKTLEDVTCSKYDIKDYKYNYLVVKDTKYSIYKNGTIIANEFDYVTLYAGFFAGVKNNKLNIYSYQNGNKLITEDIELKIKDYAKAYELIISKDGNIINVFIDDSSKITYKYNLDWKTDEEVEAERKAQEELNKEVDKEDESE